MKASARAEEAATPEDGNATSVALESDEDASVVSLSGPKESSDFDSSGIQHYVICQIELIALKDIGADLSPN